MASRPDLQILLENLLKSRNVYFQPPESIKMKYPAIVYELNDIENTHADNGVYSSYKQYTITVIDINPDSNIVDMVVLLPTCRFERYFTSENLNHWVFSIYY